MQLLRCPRSRSRVFAAEMTPVEVRYGACQPSNAVENRNITAPTNCQPLVVETLKKFRNHAVRPVAGWRITEHTYDTDQIRCQQKRICEPDNPAIAKNKVELKVMQTGFVGLSGAS